MPMNVLKNVNFSDSFNFVKDVQKEKVMLKITIIV